MKPVVKRPPSDTDAPTVEELALAHVLEQCLQAMERGETHIETLLRPYPDAAEEIRPLLKIALNLRRRGDVLPISLAFKEKLHEQLMRQRARA